MQEKIPKIGQNLKKKTDRVMSIHALLQIKSVFHGMLLHAAGQYAAIASEACREYLFLSGGAYRCAVAGTRREKQPSEASSPEE